MEFLLLKIKNEYYDCDKYGFKLYKKYSRKDVIRLLNWENTKALLYMGIDSNKYNTVSIFVTYCKNERIKESQKFSNFNFKILD